MIAVAHEKSSYELLSEILKLGVKAYRDILPGGDYCFEGQGPEGRCLVGIERKKLDDILNCIKDGRFSGHQQPEMKLMYRFRILIVEGVYKADRNGDLMRMVPGGWKPVSFGNRRILYSHISRYLISVTLTGGTCVMRSRDGEETARLIVDTFHWFQKPWDNHVSQQQFHTPALPQFSKPKYCRRAAAALGEIGVKYSEAAEKLFKIAPNMMRASEADWMQIKGIGPKTAQKIVREIWDL